MSELYDLLASPFQGVFDLVAFGIYLIVFPVYHSLYPRLVRLFPSMTAKGRIDLYRRSWIESLLKERAAIQGAQQTRNLTMVASFLASSALILLGVTGNALLRGRQVLEDLPAHPSLWEHNPAAFQAKLLLLLVAFSISFMYFMAGLRHLGHFNLLIGADPDLIAREEGIPAADYFSAIINQASNRYTLGTRAFYAALPLFLWLFSTWLFLLVSLFAGLKFMGLSDFARRKTMRRG